MSEPEQIVITGTKTHTVTLPDAHLVSPGTVYTIETGQWECVHETRRYQVGDTEVVINHAFWEAPFTLTVEPPEPLAGEQIR